MQRKFLIEFVPFQKNIFQTQHSAVDFYVPDVHIHLNESTMIKSGFSAF